MAIRKPLLLALAVLGLIASGLVGCERRIVNKNETGWIPPPPPPPANSINVVISAPSGGSASDIQGLRVTLYVSSVVIKDITLGSEVTTTPYTMTFDSVGGTGTYKIVIQKTGYTLQSQLVSIVDENIPVARFGLKKIENSTTIQVETKTITEPTQTTTVIVEQPQAVKDVAPTTGKAEVTIAANSGLSQISVSSQTAAEVPPVINADNTITESIVGAVQIQTDKTTDSTISVKIPVPIDSTKFADAKGGEVDVRVYDIATQTWKSLGKGVIGADGTVQTTLSGLTSTNTIVSIGTTPKILQSAQATVTGVTSPRDIENLRRAGETQYKYDQNPTVAVTKIAHGQVPAGKPAIIPAPPGIQAWQWSTCAPVIAVRIPELAPWIYDGIKDKAVTLPDFVAEIRRLRTRATFNFTYKFGKVDVVFTVRIDYTAVNVIAITHSTGFGGGG